MANFPLLWALGAPFKGLFTSAKATEMDERFPKIPNFTGGSDHTLDASASVSLRGTVANSNELLLDIPIRVPSDKTLKVLGTSGHPATIDINAFAAIGLSSGGTFAAGTGSFLTIGSGVTCSVTSDWNIESGAKLRAKSGSSVQIDDGAIGNFAAYYSPDATDTYAASITIDWNKSNHHNVTLTGNTAFASSNEQNGALYTVMVTQDVTGGHTTSWGGSFAFGTVSSSADGTAGATTIWLFKCGVGFLIALSRNVV